LDVLVVGGGIVGCAVAAACARRGMGVTLVERGALASDASSLDLALLGTQAPAGLERRAREAEERYLELHHFTGRSFFLDRSPVDCEGVPDGLVRRIDVRGAALALADEARSYRAEIRTGCEVKGLLVRGETVRGARTDVGELRATATVVAAGAESWRVCRAVGLHVPVEEVEGVCRVYPPGAVPLVRPRVTPDGWAALDEAGRAVVAVAGSASHGTFLPELAHLGPLDRRALRYGDTADGMPLEGPLPGVQGLVLACGHGLHGVALAPAAGETVAGALEGGDWDEALLPGRLLLRAG
jgi:glycine/D-amino acid oxidase-like deaminating enzyme